MSFLKFIAFLFILPFIGCVLMMLMTMMNVFLLNMAQ